MNTIIYIAGSCLIVGNITVLVLLVRMMIRYRKIIKENDKQFLDTKLDARLDKLLGDDDVPK